jgi:starch phosphorylase
MKAALNGVLHMSVLDGWWAEAYRPGLGWAVGSGEVYDDTGYQDYVEARAVYDLLEKEVVPLFYDRGPDDLPRRWISMMKASIRDLGLVFNTNRMLYEYTQRFYLPAAQRSTHLVADGGAAARALAAWKQRLRAEWPNVRVEAVDAPGGDVAVGIDLPVRARVHLGGLSPDDVSVQLYDGPVDAQGNIAGGQAVEMVVDGPAHVDGADAANGGDGFDGGTTAATGGSEGTYTYAGTIPCRSSGLHGYSVRVLPRHADLANPFEPALVTWAR